MNIEAIAKFFPLIISLVSDILDGLEIQTRKGDPVYDIDIQCQQRFGKSWEEVKKQMLDAMSNITFAGERTIDPEWAVKGIGLAGGTRDWMTNKYLAILYLHFTRQAAGNKEYLDHVFERVVDTVSERKESGPLSMTDGLYWDLLLIAHRHGKEGVESILKRHGLLA